MVNVRVRPEGDLIFFDFRYQGVRCREQTALTATPENLKRVQVLANRMQREIAQGSFSYAAHFPNSARASQFSERGVADVQASESPVERTAAQAIVEIPLFSDFSTTWRAEMAPQWRRLHRDGVNDIFTKHLLPAFGARPIAAIAKPDVLTFRAGLAKLPGRAGKTLSASRINKVMAILRQMLTEAADRFGIADVFRGIKRLKARKSEVQPFSMEEVDRIRAAIRSDYRPYVTTRFFTGMRTGEINGLRWKNVDFENGLILVREVFSAGEAEDNAKNETSLRDIPMLPIVREALEAQRRERHATSDYVFCSRDGTPLDAHNFATRVWYPLLRFLDIEKRRPYQTRHTTATLMLASGENPEWIAKLMGHANTQMLFTVYSRFVPNLTRQDGRAITGLLNSRSATTSTPTSSTPAHPASTPSPAHTSAPAASLAPALATMSREQLEALICSLTATSTSETHHAR